MLDALAQGIPVVARPLAAEGIDVEDQRKLLIGATSEAFCSCVLALLAYPALRQRLAAAAYDVTAFRYAVDRIGEWLAEVYSDVCQMRRWVVHCGLHEAG